MQTTPNHPSCRTEPVRTARFLRALLTGGIVLGSLLSCFAKGFEAPPAEATSAARQPTTVAELPRHCRRCHYCDSPSSFDLCLVEPCERFAVQAELRAETPDVIVLNTFDGACLPVPFDHRRHATMAEMGDGCATCHHHTPLAAAPPPCSTCHERSTAGTDIDKPGLKGAYHQQCLNCHRDWIDETACEFCHVPGPGPVDAASSPSCATGNGFLTRDHPRILPPASPLYRTRVSASPLRVRFGHNTHVDRFGLRCVECHHAPNCARCHNPGQEPRTRTLVEHHRPCVKCHKPDMTVIARDAGRCDRCHWQEGQRDPLPFDHAATGWPLKAYHERLGCRACHTRVPFEVRDTTCDSCHSGWDAPSFDHAVTGQILDATHASLECENCHLERKFEPAPVCDVCHDPEEGVSFPQRRPGPVQDLVAPAD